MRESFSVAACKGTHSARELSAKRYQLARCGIARELGRRARDGQPIDAEYRKHLEPMKEAFRHAGDCSALLNAKRRGTQHLFGQIPVTAWVPVPTTATSVLHRYSRQLDKEQTVYPNTKVRLPDTRVDTSDYTY